jgi:hypothetical protein
VVESSLVPYTVDVHCAPPFTSPANYNPQDAAILKLTARVEAAESQAGAVLNSLEQIQIKTESVTKALMSKQVNDSTEKAQVQQTLKAVRALAVQAWVALENQTVGR